MTIHHDKLAYGKLAAVKEEVSQKRLEEMLAGLNGGCDKSRSGGEEGEPCAAIENPCKNGKIRCASSPRDGGENSGEKHGK